MFKISAALLILAFGLIVFGVVRVITAAQGQTVQTCISTADRDRITALTLEAIDGAFKDQVAHLFTVWLKDYSPEPKRATVGMANSISAYQRARANAFAWQPPVCKE